MSDWLFKEEPSSYSFTDLERDGQTIWSGVTNATALIHLRQIRKGDRILFYHTGAEKAVIGMMEAAADAEQDPEDETGKLVVVKVEPVRRLGKPVLLSDIKADKSLAAWELVRNSRLSVMPVPPAIWKKIEKMGQ